MNPALRVDDLSLRLRTETGPLHPVDRVSFTLNRGEILALVGESGCGKSLTALALLGLLPAGTTLTGRIELDGETISGVGERRLRAVRGRRIGMIFQEPMTSLNPVLTVGRQISQVIRRHHGLGRAEARERAVELLELVGIPAARARLREYPHQLSGGMRQRVMIAMAVACDPAVLIADEPTTALDVTVQAGILDLLRDLRKRLGTAILLITHDLGVVADVADRVMVMYAGRKVEEAPLDELFANPRHPYTRGLLGAVPDPGQRAGEARLREIPGLVPHLRQQPDHCAFAPRCPLAIDPCRAAVPPLDTIDTAHRVACVRAAEVHHD